MYLRWTGGSQPADSSLHDHGAHPPLLHLGALPTAEKRCSTQESTPFLEQSNSMAGPHGDTEAWPPWFRAGQLWRPPQSQSSQWGWLRPLVQLHHGSTSPSVQSLSPDSLTDIDQRILSKIPACKSQSLVPWVPVLRWSPYQEVIFSQDQQWEEWAAGFASRGNRMCKGLMGENARKYQRPEGLMLWRSSRSHWRATSSIAWPDLAHPHTSWLGFSHKVYTS